MKETPAHSGPDEIHQKTTKTMKTTLPALAATLLGAVLVLPAPAQEGNPERRPAGIPRTMKRHDRPDPPARPSSPTTSDSVILEFPLEVRTIDGAGNNLANPLQGSAETTVLRLAAAAYEDGADTPSGSERPNAREISNAVFAQREELPNEYGATDYLWQWGQFLDHDIVETPAVDPEEPFDIAVPTGDPWFDPYGSGTATIGLNRSLYEQVSGVREQVNAITAYIDASNVYGSDDARAFALRTLDGTGKLQTSDGDLLPWNTEGLPNAGGTSSSLFLAGDVRANEQVGLAAMHTLFVREHNHWAATIAGIDPTLSDDEIYQMARMIIAAEMQAITYREFLPVLLGTKAMAPYSGYRANTNASISNEFAVAAYRIGHTMLSPTLLRIDADGSEIAEGHLDLADAFFRPDRLVATGVDPVLRGLAAQSSQQIDAQLIDGVRNFLFGPPGAGGLDLASLNIQRGRDHGLPGYNGVRVAFGLAPVTDFDHISDDPDTVASLAAVYSSVDEIDPWVGMLAETHVEGAMVGETAQRVLADQFRRLRDGDRFYYKRYLPKALVDLVERQTLARIIRHNTGIGDELPDNVFVPGTPVVQEWFKPTPKPAVRKTPRTQKKRPSARSRNSRR